MMKTLFASVAALGLVVGLSGAALAAPGTNNGHANGVSCLYQSNPVGNPGALIQAAKTDQGVNSAALALQDLGNTGSNPGQTIQAHCSSTTP